MVENRQYNNKPSHAAGPVQRPVERLIGLPRSEQKARLAVRRRALQTVWLHSDWPDHRDRQAPLDHHSSPGRRWISPERINPPHPEDAECSLRPAQPVGRYAVLRKLGQGGMGQVYAARDEESQRDVAIKILHPRQADLEGTVRLLREAQAMAKLSHPNVARIYEAGQIDGRSFIAMELIQGMTLSQWCDVAPRSWPDVLSLYVQAGRGLAAVHRAGIIHRDFKPENVLVGDDGRPRVLDFGLALLANGPDIPASDACGAEQPSGSRLTQQGVLLGTPYYMSPEQLSGDPVGPASDQFNFCVGLYESLYGVAPFEGRGMAQAAAKVHGDVRQPAVKSADLERLRNIIVRGLAPDPTDRWPSMDDLLGVLGEQLNAGSAPSLRLPGRPALILFGLSSAVAALLAVTMGWVIGGMEGGMARDILGISWAFAVLFLSIGLAVRWSVMSRVDAAGHARTAAHRVGETAG
ncbi:MAG: serine/threonine protein kinase [Proteobacteria bacterium]|nr:serine/threonine protein kinase [Pseudomonadota bacterium]